MSPKMPFKVKNGLPIRATSAYQFFFNEKYAKMKQKSPEKTSQETNKEIGQMWRESGPKERVCIPSQPHTHTFFCVP